MVDTIFADVAQPDQARIVAINAHNFLKNQGHFVISIKVLLSVHVKCFILLVCWRLCQYQLLPSFHSFPMYIRSFKKVEMMVMLSASPPPSHPLPLPTHTFKSWIGALISSSILFHKNVEDLGHWEWSEYHYWNVKLWFFWWSILTWCKLRLLLRLLSDGLYVFGGSLKEKKCRVTVLFQ